MHRAWLAVALTLVVAVPVAHAGTREDPELRDPAHDERRWPGVPTADPTVDILGIWFEETATDVLVSLEVAQLGPDGPDVPNVSGGESYSVNVFVDGEDQGDERCSGWGDFGVRWSSGQSTANLRQGWHYDGQACPAEDQQIAVAAAGNVVCWTVPKASLPMLVAGSVLTIARADAGSGDTWPATPGDDVDAGSGRAFATASSPNAANGSQPASLDPAPAGTPTTDPGSPPTGDGPQPAAAPAPGVLLAPVALALAALARKRGVA